MLEINGEKHYTTEETALLLKVTVTGVRKYCREGKLSAERLNGCFMISATAIKDFCKTHSKAAAK